MPERKSVGRRALPCALIGWILLSVPIVRAGSGSYAFLSLTRPMTVREAAWGSLEGSAARGPEALRANPAGIAEVTSATIMVAHQLWLSDMQQEWSGYVTPIGRGVAIAVEAAATHAGALDAYDEDGAPTGSFSPIEGFAGIGVGIPASEGIRVGGSLHALYVGAMDDHLTAYSASFGLESATGLGTVGIALRNIGPDPRGKQGTYHLPSSAVLGFSRSIKRLGFLTLTGALDREKNTALSGGAGWVPTSAFALLAGISYGSDDEGRALHPGVGVEVGTGSVRAGYAYAVASDAPPTHLLSVLFSLRGRESRAGGDGRITAPHWSVWGGVHREREGAEAEVRGLEMQGVRAAAIIPRDDGTFRVRVARDLKEGEARELARSLHAEASPD